MPQLITKLSFDTSPKTLIIPAGKETSYRVSQMDDYSRLTRNKFLHTPPLSLSLHARVSDCSLPGTWGFGFWNDPFAMGIGIRGSSIRLPAMPEAVWFFYGSPKNDLSFHSMEPANGWMTSVFTSKSVPIILLPLGLPFLPFLKIKSTAKWIRKLVSGIIQDDFARLDVDVTNWNTYRLNWLPDQVRFFVDDIPVFMAPISPKPPLGLVIWIDNQFAAFSADGSVRFGTEENRMPASLEIKNLEITSNFTT